LFRRNIHRDSPGATYDVASVHFGPTISRTDILVPHVVPSGGSSWLNVSASSHVNRTPVISHSIFSHRCDIAVVLYQSREWVDGSWVKWVTKMGWVTWVMGR